MMRVEFMGMTPRSRTRAERIQRAGSCLRLHRTISNSAAEAHCYFESMKLAAVSSKVSRSRRSGALRIKANKPARTIWFAPALFALEKLLSLQAGELLKAFTGRCNAW